MIAVDTSVVVAAALDWHVHHTIAVDALKRTERAHLPQHAAVESYSVLTRLPESQRLQPAMAREYVRGVFESPPLMLGPEHADELLDLASRNDIVGGAIYDAVVAATALHAGAVLWTFDRRAVPTYARLGLDYHLLA